MRAVDFDDLVVAPARILSEHPDIRERWRNRFRYLMVDEFQDTNRSQLELTRLLTNELNNVCVVGDDDQSIYGWRGADVGNILDFERHFTGTKVVKLEDNYRSTQIILDAAAGLVEPGGLVVYATCSLEPEENEEQVERFLARHQDFRREAPDPAWVRDASTDEKGDLRVLPWQWDTDGAFASRLRRI